MTVYPHNGHPKTYTFNFNVLPCNIRPTWSGIKVSTTQIFISWNFCCLLWVSQWHTTMKFYTIVHNTSGHDIKIFLRYECWVYKFPFQKHVAVKKVSHWCYQKTNIFWHVSLFLKGGHRLINLITITYVYFCTVLIILDSAIHVQLILIWSSYCMNNIQNNNTIFLNNYVCCR